MFDLPTLGNEYGWLANVIQIAQYVGLPSLSAVVVWLLRDRNLKKAAQEHLVATVSSLSQQLTDANEQLAHARSHDPHEWIAAYEQAADRHAAITTLLEGLSHTIEPLRRTFHAIALCREDSYPLHGEGSLLEARRMARIAALLDPANKESLEHLHLVDAIIEIKEIKAGTYDPDLNIFDIPQLERLAPDVAVPYVSTLLEMAIRKIHAGDGVTYELVTRRAREIAMQCLPADDGLVLNARQLWAESLAVNKLFSQAHEEVKAILPTMKATMQPDDRRLMEILLMDAHLLIALGDPTGLSKVMEAAKLFDEFKDLTQPYGDFEFPPTEVSEELRQAASKSLSEAPASFKDENG